MIGNSAEVVFRQMAQHSADSSRDKESCSETSRGRYPPKKYKNFIAGMMSPSYGARPVPPQRRIAQLSFQTPAAITSPPSRFSRNKPDAHKDNVQILLCSASTKWQQSPLGDDRNPFRRRQALGITRHHPCDGKHQRLRLSHLSVSQRRRTPHHGRQQTDAKES